MDSWCVNQMAGCRSFKGFGNNNIIGVDLINFASVFLFTASRVLPSTNIPEVSN